MGYESNPNQRDISINKSKGDADNPYTSFRLDALQMAMHTLTPKAFELWCYFGKNKDGYKFFLSKVDCLQWCNFSKSSYSNAFQELISYRYLIPRDKESAEPKHYDFYELPKEEEQKVEIEVHKEKVFEF